MDDRQIIALYDQRDERAIAETASKYGSYCFSIAYNILISHEDSEECVNDTWLKTWRSIPLQRPNCLKAYLAQITKNLAINRYNAKKSGKWGNGEIALAFDEIDIFLAGSSDIASEVDRQNS